MKKGGFTQIDNSLLEKVIKAGLTATELEVFFALVRYTRGFHQTSCKLSYGRLAKLTNKSERSVIRAIEGLYKKRIIARISKFSTGLSTGLSTNAYVVYKDGDIDDIVDTDTDDI